MVGDEQVAPIPLSRKHTRKKIIYIKTFEVRYGVKATVESISSRHHVFRKQSCEMAAITGAGKELKSQSQKVRRRQS